MRFIHTADWHLGRLFHGVHLTEDQAHVLDQFVAFAKDEKPDAILISGDIYDRAVPPPDAVQLLDDVLSRLVAGLKIPTFLIAGNHDSPDRLSFASRILGQHGLHVAGRLASAHTPFLFHDAHGPIRIVSLPYAEPAMVRSELKQEDIHDHQAATSAMLNALRSVPQALKSRSILLAHAFVDGGTATDSERPLSLGGSGTVSPGCFDGFDYVALGHLHQPQFVGRESIRYSGSLLKYSFSESEKAKSIYIVEMDAHGACAVKTVALSPRRDVRCVTAPFAELLKGPLKNQSSDDYLMVTLTDQSAIWNALPRLRDVYSNLLCVEKWRDPAAVSPVLKFGYAQRNTLDLFGDFFAQVQQRPLSEIENSEFSKTLDALNAAGREAPA